MSINKQLPIEITADGRGIRFDIYMEDDEKTIYNVEMQAGSVAELPFRTRYYQGMIDLDQIERGADFSELKTTYIIFICLENPFPKVGLHKYSFRSICLEDPHLELGDGVEKVLLSSKGNKDDVSAELSDFLDYIAGNRPQTDLTKRLNELVERARTHLEWRKEYMTLLERDDRMRKEGYSEGLSEGLVALVHTLRRYISDSDELINAVRENPEYADADPAKIRLLLVQMGK